jgi:hypothetical protein
MSLRHFVDRSGQHWRVRVHSRGDWEFRPEPGNRAAPRRGEPPYHATDPFELSEQELQTILADLTPVDRPGGAPSPFRDESGAQSSTSPGGSLFEDYQPPPKPKSPFRDDRQD